MTLDGKRVVVIGGSSGIGLAVARAALDAGAAVTIASRSQDRLDAAAAYLERRVETAALDVSDPEGLCRFFDGLGELHHLVGAANVKGRQAAHPEPR